MIKGISKKTITDIDYTKATNLILKTVGSTLGPVGSNVIIREPNKDPFSTKDGVTVFKHLRVDEEGIDSPLQIIHQASQKTSDNAGDGTTTTAVLASLLLNNYKNYDTKINKYLFRKELTDIGNTQIELIKEKYSKPINSLEDIKRVATLSGNNSEYIGNLLSTAYEMVGINGNVMISPNTKFEDEIEVVEGLQFKKGYASPFFITDHKKRESKLENPLILIYNGKVNTVDGFIVPMNLASEEGKPLFIISDDLGGEALATLVANHSNNIMQINNVVIPGLGEARTNFIYDVATITGAKVIDPEKGHQLKDFKKEFFGKADNVNSTRLETTIVGGKGDSKKIDERVKEILVQLEDSISPLEREHHNIRLEKISGKLSLIKVGASTKVEQREKIDMIDDALKSVRASLKNGVSLGGGYTYLNSLPNVKKNETETMKIYRQSIIDYIRLLVNNEENEEKVINSLKNSRGYNILLMKKGNLEQMGIIDATSIITEVIKNAISVVGTLLISDTIIAPDKISKPDIPDFM